MGVKDEASFTADPIHLDPVGPEFRASLKLLPDSRLRAMKKIYGSGQNPQTEAAYWAVDQVLRERQEGRSE